MEKIINRTNTATELITPLLSLIFCVLALFVLVYYIRRRYKLYKEINRIPQELLILESDRNHLKNLKLKCIISNFIIVILVMEFIQNLGQTLRYFPYSIHHFIKEFNVSPDQKVQRFFCMYTTALTYSLVPVLTMMMDFLWLAYSKYEYKYTMIRWTWYIVIRALVVFLAQYTPYFIPTPFYYEIVYSEIGKTLYLILPTIDLIQFVYYARKFYLHLKSREKEIKLFYFDKEAYLDIKYLRIHFKVATILVGIALFFCTLSTSIAILSVICQIPDKHKVIPQHLYEISFIMNYYFELVNNISYFISQVLFIFNYLYIFIVVVYKSYRDGQKLKNINSYIKPIMKQYHDNYYKRYTNYA